MKTQGASHRTNVPPGATTGSSSNIRRPAQINGQDDQILTGSPRRSNNSDSRRNRASLERQCSVTAAAPGRSMDVERVSEVTALLSDQVNRHRTEENAPAPSSMAERVKRADAVLARRFIYPDPLRGTAEEPPELAASRSQLEIEFKILRLDGFPDPHIQSELVDRFIHDRACADAAYRIVYGPKFGLGTDMSQSLSDGALSAAFEALRGGISSMFRSPARNFVVAEYSPPPGAQLDFASVHHADTRAGGGALGGLLTYFKDKAIDPALKARAEAANLPEMVEVPAHIIVPEPGPIQLYIGPGVAGQRLARPYIAARGNEPALYAEGLPRPLPSMEQLETAMVEARATINRWQKALKGEHYMSLLQPLLTGALNAPGDSMVPQERRGGGTAFAASLIGSSMAGALAKGTAELIKSTPLASVVVPNSMGQPQRMAMFTPQGRSDPLALTAKWSDARRLPRAAADALLDSIRHAGRTLKDFWHRPGSSSMDLLMRYVGPNGFVGVVAPAGAEVTLEPFNGLFSSNAFEAAKRGLSSGVNEYLWPLLQRNMEEARDRSDIHRRARERIRSADHAQLVADKAVVNAQMAEVRARLLEQLHTCPAEAPLLAADRQVLEQAGNGLQGGKLADQVRALLLRLERSGEAHHDAVDALQRTALRLVDLHDEGARLDRKLEPWYARMTGRTAAPDQSPSP